MSFFHCFRSLQQCRRGTEGERASMEEVMVWVFSPQSIALEEVLSNQKIR